MARPVTLFTGQWPICPHDYRKKSVPGSCSNSVFATVRPEPRGRDRWRASFHTMHDTTAAAQQVRLAAIRSVAPIDRLSQAFELSEWARALALSRLRKIHGGRTELELVELLLGTTLVPQRSMRTPA